MKYSRFLGLKLPEQEDFYNVDDFNSNSIIIEENIDQLHYEAMRRVINSGGVPSIQAGLDAEKPAAGTAGRLYVATDTQMIYLDTGTEWVKVGVVNWNDIAGKPTSFTPSTHASTHASGGSDPITPAMIGAVAKTGDTMTGPLTISSNAGDILDIVGKDHAYIEFYPRGLANGRKAYIGYGSSNSTLLTIGQQDNGGVEVIVPTGHSFTVNSNTVWHSGNHGPGSGLNADLLDGLHAVSFARKDAAETIASDWTIGDNNLRVLKQRSVGLKIDTRSVVLIYGTDGRLTKVEEKDGTTVVKTTNLTYDASGRLSQVQEIARGTTVTSTLSYDANGKLASISKAVS